MKFAYTTVLVAVLLVPNVVLAGESLVTDRFLASFADDGSWQLTDKEADITWQGQWLSPDLMKVVGSDDSCFIIGESERGMVQLGCENLKEISMLVSR